MTVAQPQNQSFIPTRAKTKDDNEKKIIIKTPLNQTTRLDVVLIYIPLLNTYSAFVPDTCESHQKLLHVLSGSARLVVGSFHPEVCASAKQLAEYFNATLLSWNCPAVSFIFRTNFLDRVEFFVEFQSAIEVSKQYDRLIFVFISSLSEMRTRSG